MKILASLIAFVTGIIAIPFVFSDPAPGESVLLRIVSVVVVFGVGGFLVSWTARGQWRLASFCAWTPIAMGLLMLWGKLQTGNTPPYWSAIVGFLFAPLLVSLLGGLAARQLRGGIAAKKAPPV